MPTHDSIQAITTAIADSSGLPGPASVVTTSCVVEDVQSTSSGCVDELLFWAKELSQWNAFGRKLFPDSVPCTIRIDGDAGPEGWGAQGRRASCMNMYLLSLDSTMVSSWCPRRPSLSAWAKQRGNVCGYGIQLIDAPSYPPYIRLR
jgi:hypothetical protein